MLATKYLFIEEIISRTKENGGDLKVCSYDNVKEAFKKGNLHPQDLKRFVDTYINKIFDPIRERLRESQQSLLQLAFPVNKGNKKKKN